MTVKTRLAVLFVMACLLTAAWLLLHTDQAHARPPVPPPVYRAVHRYWPTRRERIEALNVSYCESRFSIYAKGGDNWGLFQLGGWARARYGHGWTAMTQARAAYRYYLDSGKDWSPWTCRA